MHWIKTYKPINPKFNQDGCIMVFFFNKKNIRLMPEVTPLGFVKNHENVIFWEGLGHVIYSRQFNPYWHYLN